MLETLYMLISSWYLYDLIYIFSRYMYRVTQKKLDNLRRFLKNIKYQELYHEFYFLSGWLIKQMRSEHLIIIVNFYVFLLNLSAELNKIKLK